jgi:glycosyltransferase involved in cell wall biosynthesis
MANSGPNLKPQLIDMIRSVPEVAVRLWAGGQARSTGDSIKIQFENRETEASPEVFFAAERVAKSLSVRWMGRLLRTIQDVLELRHAAEDLYLEDLFQKTGVPRVLFIPAGTTASGYYRAMIPSDVMYEGGRVISHWTASIDVSKAIRYDILWIQLVTSGVLIEIAKMAQEQGVKVIYDIDDRLDSIPAENQAITIYGDPVKQAEINTMIRLADLVTVSTAPLMEHILARGAKAVKVVRNMLTANVIPRRHPPNPKFVRIVWAGSPTHKRDLAIVAPAIRNILKRYGGKVRFTCFGERLPEILADCYDFIDLKDPVDFEVYHDMLASCAADFGIAPLEANPFNEAKSAIKAYEYASAGYPMLLSPVGEYPVAVSDGLPAELVADDQWEAALERMIALPRAERDRMGKACTDWVCANRCVGKTKGAQWADVALEIMGKLPKPEPVLKA